MASTWGHGPAKLVKPATKEATELVVFLSDVHVPYQDEAAVAAAVRMVKKLQPHRVVLNGDINDFFQLSRFDTRLERIDELQAEIDEGVAFRKQIRDAAPNAIIDETEGNHDNRLLTYVAQNARSLVSLRALRPEHLLGYKELGVRWHPGAGFRLREHFLVKHGTLVRGEAGASAKAEHMLSGLSGVSGHTHRLAPYRKSGYQHREWWEQGCLCRTDPDYVVGVPNWQQGCVVAELATRTPAFRVYEAVFDATAGVLRVGRDSY